MQTYAFLVLVRGRIKREYLSRLRVECWLLPCVLACALEIYYSRRTHASELRLLLVTDIFLLSVGALELLDE